jgi:hypothetical protein
LHADCINRLAPMAAPVSLPTLDGRHARSLRAREAIVDAHVGLRADQGLEPAQACRVLHRTLAALPGAGR